MTPVDRGQDAGARFRSPPSLAGKGAGGIGAAPLSLTPSTVSTANGKQTSVAVAFDASRLMAHGSRSLGAWTIDVRYDATEVKVVSCTPRDGSLCNASYAPGVVRISGASASGLTGSQALATLVFEGIGHGEAASTLTLATVTLAAPDGSSLQAGR